MSVFDDNLWDTVKTDPKTKVEPKNTNVAKVEIDGFWAENTILPPKVEEKPPQQSIDDTKKDNSTGKLDENKTLNSNLETQMIPTQEYPTVQFVQEPPEFEENYAHFLKEPIILLKLPEVTLQTNDLAKELETLPKGDNSNGSDSILDKYKELFEKFAKLESLSINIQQCAMNNQNTLSKHISNLNNALYTNSRIALSTTNNGKHLSVIGKDFLDISPIYQDKLGGVIESLDFSWNRIQKVNNLDRFTRLVSLVLDNNQISYLTDFPYIPTLTTLWLNNNLITDIDDTLSNLQDLRLKSVSFLENPCSPKETVELQKYRYHVLSKLMHVTHLDMIAVSSAERNEANKRMKIKEAFGKYQSDPEDSDEDGFEKKVKRVVKTQVKEIKKQAVVIEDHDVLNDHMTPVEAFNLTSSVLPKVSKNSSVFDDTFWDK